MRYVIAYDVTDDRQRAKLADLLLDYGDRVQKSVFEAEITAVDLKELLGKAAKFLGKEDSLRAYPLCQACARGLRSFGRPADRRPPDGRIV